MYGSGIILVMFAVLISSFAQNKVNSTYNKYSKVISQSGYSGYEVARKILDKNGLYNVPIEMVAGRLSDHYDPTKRVLRLSRDVYNGNSVASIGVAAHEVGHAVQHEQDYSPLAIRNSIAPIVSFSSKFLWLVIFGGIILSLPGLVTIGIGIYILAIAFQLITLPVEFDASNRAIASLEQGILSPAEIKPTRKVLNAAAFTYVAATLASIAQLIRLIGISNRRN